MTERVVAVVCAYWPERFANVQLIIDRLRSGTRPPDRIIVLGNDNASGETIGVWQDDDQKIQHADVVSCTWNTWTRGKYVVGLLDPADWYLLIDDDVAPGPTSVEHLLDWGHQLQSDDGRFITGFWGARIVNGSFMQGQIIQPHKIKVPMRVDSFHGRYVFMSFRAITRLFEAEADVRLGTEWQHEGCDIIAGLANADAAWCVPVRGASSWQELPLGSRSLQFEHGYFAERDRFVADMLPRLQQARDE